MIVFGMKEDCRFLGGGLKRRLKSAARGGRKVQRWGWVWNLLRQVICSKDRSVRPSVPLVVAVSGHL